MKFLGIYYFIQESKSLRKAVSDAALLIGTLHDDEIIEANNYDIKVAPIEQVQCECCGMKEDCSSNYIEQVKGIHTGRWVCGLCSEAVKERLTQASPNIVMGDALSLHKQFCLEFKATRMNPKGSLTCAMRDIARRSCQQRMLTKDKPLMVSKLARSSSCVPRIDH
ncbi:hypothetical protein Cgig2_018815 [Carnegiea gigantea]|uniref:Uncharacterized protein n=1 Tax=Carnegiea gigantea TaxID=171969 RepID=A0A9Q1QIF4_9CARY|nr:hypothetical protein Cgig2_018815 [Carnegiea gigantea]